MSDPFIGQIMLFAGNFAPRGWATCDGQLLAISQNTALFSLLGTTYGGNGVTNFALPDLRGRVALHQGTGPGLSTYVEGEVGGVENVTLIQTQMPVHTHVAASAVNVAASSLAPTDDPSGGVPAGGTGVNIYTAAPDGNTKMNGGMVTTTIQPAGGSQPHENRQPYLCMLYCIALNGIFPSRN